VNWRFCQWRLNVSNEFDLRDDDVIHVEHSLIAFGISQTFKISQLKQAVREYFKHPSLVSKWFVGEGVECQILQVQGGGWQNGRFRFRLEFIPDQPEPPKSSRQELPLDDLRSKLNME
jgi:hypothetical protein